MKNAPYRLVLNTVPRPHPVTVAARGGASAAARAHAGCSVSPAQDRCKAP